MPLMRGRELKLQNFMKFTSFPKMPLMRGRELKHKDSWRDLDVT